MIDLNRFYNAIMDILLQIFILICLLAVIFLLSIDKVKIIQVKKTTAADTVEVRQPDVMGKINNDKVHQKSVERTVSYTNALEGEHIDVADLKNDDVSSSPVSVIDDKWDYDEEEDWPDNEQPAYDDRFSSGVSLEDLSRVGTLLQQDVLETEQEKDTITIVQKIQGTEFFNTLMDSVENSSVKIAKLLDKRLDEIKDNSLQSNSDDFQIDDFL